MKKLIYLPLILGLFTTVSSCKREGSDQTKKSADINKYTDYISQVDKNISKLSPERNKQRNKWLSELKSSDTYVALVDSSAVSQEYLPVLSAISDAIKNAALDNEGKSTFSIDEPLAKAVESSKDGEIKMAFVISVSCLALKMNGGLPKELVTVFERYRGKFNLYGSKDDIIVDSSGKQEKIASAYNLSYAFALLNPKEEKALDAIYESIQKGIGHWNSEDTEYENAYMATRKAYMQHLREFYSDSPYLIKADFEITPEKLYSDYEINEVAADEKYKNKTVALTGTIHNIGKDVLDKPYISFQTDYLKLVTCYFSDDAVKQIATLKKGETIIIIGKCRGLTLTNVVLVDCKIVE